MEILYQDQNLIVCIKEVGIDSEHQMPALIKEITNSDVYVVHRLDLNVSGIMVYALNKHTAAYLSKLISENKLIKEYKALIHGHLGNQQDTLVDYLFKDSRKRKVFVVKKERKGVKRASLEYQVLKETLDYSYIHVLLHTGRTHQIRVQFASRKHPLVGDHKYGARDNYKLPRLYSCAISFPYNNEMFRFESNPDWSDILDD